MKALIEIDVSNDWSIWITLGLSGELSEHESSNSRIQFITSKGIFYINDPLNFGTIHFIHEPGELTRKLGSLGPDPLQEKVTPYMFTTKLNKMKPDLIIADALMDQSLLSGVGNYIRAEALYDANISPFTTIKELNEEDRDRLLTSIKR